MSVSPNTKQYGAASGRANNATGGRTVTATNSAGTTFPNADPAANSFTLNLSEATDGALPPAGVWCVAVVDHNTDVSGNYTDAPGTSLTAGVRAFRQLGTGGSLPASVVIGNGSDSALNAALNFGGPFRIVLIVADTLANAKRSSAATGIGAYHYDTDNNTTTGTGPAVTSMDNRQDGYGRRRASHSSHTYSVAGSLHPGQPFTISGTLQPAGGGTTFNLSTKNVKIALSTDSAGATRPKPTQSVTVAAAGTFTTASYPLDTDWASAPTAHYFQLGANATLGDSSTPANEIDAFATGGITGLTSSQLAWIVLDQANTSQFASATAEKTISSSIAAYKNQTQTTAGVGSYSSSGYAATNRLLKRTAPTDATNAIGYFETFLVDGYGDQFGSLPVTAIVQRHTDSATENSQALTTPSTNSTTPDSSGNSRLGTLIGTVLPALIAGESGFGNRLSFDGVDRNDNSSGVQSATLNLTPTAFTIDHRFRRDRSGVLEYLFDWGVNLSLSSSTFNGVIVFFDSSDNKLYVALYVGGTAVVSTASTSAVSTGDHRYSIVWDGTNVKLYLDGTLQSTTALASFTTINEALVVGRNLGFSSGDANSPYPFQGDMDEVRISTVARDPAAVGYYTSPFTNDADTYLLWHFDSIVSLGSGLRWNWTVPNNAIAFNRLKSPSTVDDPLSPPATIPLADVPGANPYSESVYAGPFPCYPKHVKIMDRTAGITPGKEPSVTTDNVFGVNSEWLYRTMFTCLSGSKVQDANYVPTNVAATSIALGVDDCAHKPSAEIAADGLVINARVGLVDVAGRPVTVTTDNGFVRKASYNTTTSSIQSAAADQIDSGASRVTIEGPKGYAVNFMVDSPPARASFVRYFDAFADTQAQRSSYQLTTPSNRGFTSDVGNYGETAFTVTFFVPNTNLRNEVTIIDSEVPTGSSVTARGGIVLYDTDLSVAPVLQEPDSDLMYYKIYQYGVLIASGTATAIGGTSNKRYEAAASGLPDGEYKIEFSGKIVGAPVFGEAFFEVGATSSSIIAGDGLTLTGDTLSVNTDNSTLEINADTLRVKDGGVTIAKLSFDPATQAELDAHLSTVIAAAHSGNLPEARVTFDVAAGHDHDGINSKLIVTGGGGMDWTDPEKEQIRMALGITGTTAATSGAGVLDSRASQSSVDAIPGQITADHGGGSYVRNTEPDNAGIAAIKAKTDQLIFTVAGQVDANALAVPANVLNWAVRGLTMIELDGSVYRYTANALEQGPTGGGVNIADIWTFDFGSGRTPKQALQFLRNKKDASVNPVVVYAEDDTTPSWTIQLTFDEAQLPVSVADPI